MGLASACLLFFTVFFVLKPSNPLLAGRITVYSEKHTWDKSLQSGIDYLKTAYKMHRKEEH